MSDYKMSDIYALPILCENEDNHLYSRDFRHEITFDDTDTNCMEQKSAVAHAINNHDKLTEQVAELKGLLSEMNEYLNTNKLTNIASSSVFHKQMNELLTRIGEYNGRT